MKQGIGLPPECPSFGFHHIYKTIAAIKSPLHTRSLRTDLKKSRKAHLEVTGKLVTHLPCNDGSCFFLDSHHTGNYNQNTMKPAMKFDAKKTVQYWLEGAEYDLSVAEAMFEKGKYPYALFMGHLALDWKNCSKPS